MNRGAISWVIRGRGGAIRTLDLLNPIQVRYQAAPRPEGGESITRVPGHRPGWTRPDVRRDGVGTGREHRATTPVRRDPSRSRSSACTVHRVSGLTWEETSGPTRA